MIPTTIAFTIGFISCFFVTIIGLLLIHGVSKAAGFIVLILGNIIVFFASLSLTNMILSELFGGG
jgi:hypothetical protein